MTHSSEKCQTDRRADRQTTVILIGPSVGRESQNLNQRAEHSESFSSTLRTHVLGNIYRYLRVAIKDSCLLT